MALAEAGTAATRGSLLRALRSIDPQRAVEWCLTHQELARECGGDTLAEIVHESVAQGVAEGALGEFGLEYAALLAPAVLAELAGAADPVAGAQLVALGLSRAPAHPALLRLAVETAMKAAPPEAHALLTRLAIADPTPGTLAVVHRLRGRLATMSGTPVRLALLSSFTIDPVVPWLDLECRKAGLVPEIAVAPFNSWAQEIIDPASALRRFDPEIAFLSVAIDDLVPALAGSVPAAELRQLGAVAVDRLLDAAREFTRWSGAPLVIHGLHTAFPDPAGILAGRSPDGRARILAELNLRLLDGLAAIPRCYLLDMQELLVRRGGGRAEQPKMRHLAAMRLGDQVLPELARQYVQYLVPLKGLTRKVVVVDLDNTLWGGVIGEDGMAGIRLGSTAPGSEFVEFQRYLLSLSERGFLLAACSKNNADDALEAIRTHEAMILREVHFSALRINWEPKPKNLQAIAEELNVGVDSFIFVDDNPDERELMRQLLPQVLTVEMPRDPALYRGTLEALPQLQTLQVTDEDRARVATYRANREREGARVQATSIEDYLHSLEITVRLGPAQPVMLARIQQLFARTNQFNLTTRRYDLAQVTAASQDPSQRLYALSAADRFGDHGLVAVALVHVAATEWVVDSLLMSCRVIGYGIETTLLARIAADARAAGATQLAGEIVATKKNAPARDFYARHQFTTDQPEAPTALWRRSLADGGVVAPAWVTVRAHDS